MSSGPTPRAARSSRRPGGSARTSSAADGDTRSLTGEEQLFTVTLAEAEALYAQPKMRRGRQQKPPLAELGENPDNGQPVRVLEGRYGVYVTDGNVNATVPRGSDPADAHARRGGRSAARAGRGRSEEGQEGGEEDREEGDEEGREEARREDRQEAGGEDGQEARRKKLPRAPTTSQE